MGRDRLLPPFLRRDESLGHIERQWRHQRSPTKRDGADGEGLDHVVPGERDADTDHSNQGRRSPGAQSEVGEVLARLTGHGLDLLGCRHLMPVSPAPGCADDRSRRRHFPQARRQRVPAPGDDPCPHEQREREQQEGIDRIRDTGIAQQPFIGHDPHAQDQHKRAAKTAQERQQGTYEGTHELANQTDRVFVPVPGILLSAVSAHRGTTIPRRAHVPMTTCTGQANGSTMRPR